jgi:hypothetical protein
VHLPNRTDTNVIAQRIDSNGTPTERLEQEIVFHRRFYPIGPHGPLVTLQWPNKFNYLLVDPQEHRQELPFLAKKDISADYLIAFPISDDRWLAITTSEKNPPGLPVPEVLEVLVFKTNSLQFSQTVASCFPDGPPPGPWPGSRGWKPLTGKANYQTSSLSFDATNERVTFKTTSGDYLFNPNDGTLRKSMDH